MEDWTLTLRGGPWDGQTVEWPVAEPILIAWTCGGPACEGHFTMNPNAEGIVLERAVSYRRVERDEEKLTALYELGLEGPRPLDELEERELVPAGGGSIESSEWQDAQTRWAHDFIPDDFRKPERDYPPIR